MANELSLFRGAPGVERAKEIIERMRAHGVPPTPANYEIWAAFVAELRPELKQEMEALLERGEGFTDEINADLFERHFANTRLSVQILEASQSLARDLGDSVSTLRGAGQQAGAYADVLQAAITSFDAGPNPALLGQLQSATHGMVEHNRRMAEHLETSLQQVQSLKAALESMKVEALTDGLTGLANRRMFGETLERRMRDAAAAGSDLCVLLIDADHYGRLCQNWGDSLGDHVLRYIAAVLQSHAQGDMLAARFHADDFALIMPRTNLALAEALASRLSRATKAKRLSMKSTGDQIAELTVSIGVVSFRAPESAAEVLTRARQCLLAAKASGRDRVVTERQLMRAA
ncbi:MAG: GGDEF domain-containing protein [Hyphomonadaceae bacterium]|nr:GGDEF domain-containing protein [Hyphomonadaceae bacterium]